MGIYYDLNYCLPRIRNSISHTGGWLVCWSVDHTVQKLTKRQFTLHHCPCPPIRDWCRVYGLVWPFSGSEGPPRASELRVPRASNGRPIVPWEVEVKYFTTGWFHYRKTRCYSEKRWTKEYLMVWGMFWPFSGSGRPSSAPRVPKGFQSISQCAMRSRDKILYYWKTGCCLLFVKVKKRTICWFEAFFWLLPGTMGAPQGPPKGSQWTILCPMRSLDQIFYYGALSEGQGHFVLPKI